MTDHKNLPAALAAFQAELPKLRKDETAKVTGQSKSGGQVNYSYSYAGLDQVVEQVLPVLGKHGLSIMSKTTYLDGQFMLIVSLLHESGEREEAVWPLPDPRRAGPQEIGSSKTYGRRYLTLALTGTFPGGEDDDGAKAQVSQQQNRWEDARPHRQDRPVSAPPAPEKTEWTDDEVQEMHDRITSLELGKAVNGYDWMASKGLHERKLNYPGGDALTATQVLAFRLADTAANTDATEADVAIARAYAEDRGLLKVAVSNDTTLDEELALARDRIADVTEAKATHGEG